MSLHELPELRDAVLPAVCKLFSVSRQTAVLFADALVGNAEDASPMLRAAFAHSARSRFAAQAAQAEAAPCDRNGGYKSVYFTGKHVTCITRPLRFATLRQMLLELIVQSIMAERGHNVPRVRLALVRVVGTPVISLYQMVSQAERMQCTLAEFLASEAFAAMGVPERLGALVIALCSVCQGLYRLKSELGIRHGDLKPDNIMRRNADDANAMRHWCLIDFGQKVGEGGSDVFFLAWWLVHSYSRHVPPRLLRVLQRAVRAAQRRGARDEQARRDVAPAVRPHQGRALRDPAVRRAPEHRAGAVHEGAAPAVRGEGRVVEALPFFLPSVAPRRPVLLMAPP
jgi:hypothetical protein